MKYTVIVKPTAKHVSIEKISATEFRVNVKSPAQYGKANEELIRIVADFLNVPQSHISIKRGVSGRKKILEIV